MNGSVMRRNNIELIEDFIQGDNKILLVNQINEEIRCFYETVIKKISERFDIKINKGSEITNYISNDLFDDERIYINIFTNSKNIEEIFKSNYKNIIFTDYKNYKKFNKRCISINGYDFEKDLKFFLSTLKINEQNLYEYCLSSPYYTFSEISKYSINSQNYSVDPSINSANNFILNIRKDIFLIKKYDIDGQKLLLKLKTEVKYKKFNFLTY